MNISMFYMRRCPTLHHSGDRREAHVDLTVPAVVVLGAFTLVFSNVVKTGPSIETWAGGTGVWPSHFTVPPGEPVWTHTVVHPRLFSTGASITTGGRHTCIQSDFLTVLAPVSMSTFTGVAAVTLIAGAFIQTGGGVTHRLRHSDSSPCGLARLRWSDTCTGRSLHTPDRGPRQDTTGCCCTEYGLLRTDSRVL